MATCFRCGHALPAREKIFRATLCENCGADLRVCRNCEFYLPGAHWDCRETIPEAVREKDRANFCEYFRPGSRSPSAASGERGQEPAGGENARNRFESLFGDS